MINFIRVSKSRLTLMLGVLIVTMAASWLLLPSMNGQVGMLSILPVTMAAWLLGLWGGFFVSGLVIIFYLLLFYYGGLDFGILPIGVWIGFGSLAIISISVGRMSDLGDSLRVARDNLELRVAARTRELTVLNAIAATVSHSHSLNKILNDVLREVLQLDILGEGAKGMLFLLNQESNTLYLAAQQGASHNHPCLKRPPKIGECLCGLVAQTGETIISSDVGNDKRHMRHNSSVSAHTDICLPLKARGNMLGVMNVRLPAAVITTDLDIELLTAVADQISIAIENVRLNEMRQHAIADERERIAHDLHDGLAQLLGYINTKTRAARLLLADNKTREAALNLEQLEEASQLMNIEVREAILDLRLSSRIGEDFFVLLEDLIDQFKRLSNLPVYLKNLDALDKLDLDIETELQLLRIVQETLTNIRKHATASKVWINFQMDNDYLEMLITDNGKSFEYDSLVKEGRLGFGLKTMRERALKIGADIQFKTENGAGTLVHIKLPLDRRQG